MSFEVLVNNGVSRLFSKHELTFMYLDTQNKLDRCNFQIKFSNKQILTEGVLYQLIPFSCDHPSAIHVTILDHQAPTWSKPSRSPQTMEKHRRSHWNSKIRVQHQRT